jgi:hypothetical protein
MVDWNSIVINNDDGDLVKERLGLDAVESKKE